MTKPYDVANDFNNYFTTKVAQLRDAMRSSGTVSNNLITDCIMGAKQCMFEFYGAEAGDVEKVLRLLSDNEPPGIDNLECKLLSQTYLRAVMSNIQ